jgi:peptidoglycan/LPS O-acetylase OafA/YrhL
MDKAVPAPAGEGMRLRFLDGLRGWAALVVVVYHASWELFKAYMPGLHSPLPGLVNDGKLAVYVFFVLSGLVLSYPALNGGGIAFLQKTALRRYVRLVIPIAVVTFLSFAMIRLGLMANVAASHALGNEDWLGALFVTGPTFPAWVKFAFWKVFFAYDPKASFDMVLWTMPIELAGSFMVFALLALTGESLRARLFWYAAAALLCRSMAPNLLGFVAGMVLAEIMTQEWFRSRRFFGSFYGLAGLAMLAVAMLGSMFLRGAYNPQRCMALASLVVAAPILSLGVRRLLERPVSQFLARISFPLYLVHPLVIGGPISFMVLGLIGQGWSRGTMVGAVFATCLLLSLLAGFLLSGVEQFAIRTSHRFSGLILGNATRH